MQVQLSYVCAPLISMHSTIRPKHPLRILFSELVNRNLTRQLRLSDPRISEYIAGLLVDFTVTENLYRIRDARGRRLEDVGEMLIASNPMLEGRSFDYERLVRKHIGDYTLFLTWLVSGVRGPAAKAPGTSGRFRRLYEGWQRVLRRGRRVQPVRIQPRSTAVCRLI